MKTKILICSLFFFAMSISSQSSVPDSCLTLYCPNDKVNYNFDFICIDTCKNSPTYGDWFQSGTWTIGFKRFFLRDSNKIVKYGQTALLNNIDSNNFPEVYSAYKRLEDMFGEITFKRDNYACVHYSDSSYYQAPCLNIYFNRRNRTKDVEYYLNHLPDIRFVRMTHYPVKSDVPATCLTLLWSHDPERGYINPCSIQKDTCKDSPTYCDWYIRGTLIMYMKEYIFNKLMPEAGGAFVEDIDTTKYKNIRDSLLLFENRYGRIQFFRDPYECNNESDKYFLMNPCLDIDFPKYNRLKDVDSDLGSLSISRVTMLKISCQAMTNIIENFNKKISIQTNPCYDKLRINNIENKTNFTTKLEIINSLGLVAGFYEFSNELNDIEIDVSHLSNGIYFIRINNSSFKFIKLR